MQPVWILVADRSRARLFTVPNRAAKHLTEVADYSHPEAELRQGDIETDRAGRYRGEGPGVHSGEPAHDFKHLTAERFATELVDELERLRTAGELERLVVVCPPLFLGVLRKKMSDPLSRSVVLEVAKDLTLLNPTEIRDRLPQRL